MRVSRLFQPALLLFAAPAIVGTAAAQMPAQMPMVQPLDPDADELASDMRILAANPVDVNALVRAGELTLKLGDSTAAATFFARAEKIDPRNPRIKAGMGSLLVQAEKPGEALRRFAEAEALGLDARRLAADRGLAYDLIGEQERAQRDYRLALKNGTDDETIRRYALSLGISGKPDLAYKQLEPLLRRSDRGAWRARAFILAMAGDNAAAERIAANMMPPGLAQGLQPFFDRLASLGPTDRAFAVHFGELRPTPERVADSRMIPSLSPLAPEPGVAAAPIAVAQTMPRASRQDDRHNRKAKRGSPPILVSAAPPPPAPLPQPPVYVARADPIYAVPYTPPYTPSARAPETARQSMTLNPAPPAAGLAPVTPASRATVASRTTGALPEVVAQQTRQRNAAAEPDTRVPAQRPTPLVSKPEALPSVPAREAPPISARAAAPVPAPSPQPSQPVAPIASVQPTPMATTPVAMPPAPSAPPSPVSVATPTATTTSAPGTSTPLSQPSPMRSEDSILAKIIAGIAVPASELGAAPVQSAPSEPAPIEPVAPVRARPEPAPETAAADAKVAADKKALADKKAADARKLAEAKRLTDAKKAAELKKNNDPKILEPSRIWVQVAGGANESTLPKEWARVRDKAPAAFKGKSGWTTPLRATNRVLAGPFKTDGEARDFVNQLAKAGVSAFAFTSEAGQKITKLSVK